MRVLDLERLAFDKGNGLIAVVAQDVESKKVLMVAYANRDAVEKTVETGYAHYWSRSRKKLWMKGETSGNTQKIKDILVDCDRDSLVYIVEQKGSVCHTGEETCFYRRLKETDRTK